MPYHVAKKSPESCHNLRKISRREHHIFILRIFLFLRGDRKAYANNRSYRLPVVDEELTEL